MRIAFLIMAFLICSFKLLAQEKEQKEVETYDYKTALKGGFMILYVVDDSMQRLYLKKGEDIIAEIAAEEKGMLQKNLGYVGADFTDYFVLVHSYGGGNPHIIELIRKSTGENILKNWAAWIDADETREYLFYCNRGAPDKKDKMILYNIRTGKRELFPFPADIFDGSMILYRIKLKRITKNKIVIEYSTQKGVKLKSYGR